MKWVVGCANAYRVAPRFRPAPPAAAARLCKRPTPPSLINHALPLTSEISRARVWWGILPHLVQVFSLLCQVLSHLHRNIRLSGKRSEARGEIDRKAGSAPLLSAPPRLLAPGSPAPPNRVSHRRQNLFLNLRGAGIGGGQGMSLCSVEQIFQVSGVIGAGSLCTWSSANAASPRLCSARSSAAFAASTSIEISIGAAANSDGRGVRVAQQPQPKPTVAALTRADVRIGGGVGGGGGDGGALHSECRGSLEPDGTTPAVTPTDLVQLLKR